LSNFHDYCWLVAHKTIFKKVFFNHHKFLWEAKSVRNLSFKVVAMNLAVESPHYVLQVAELERPVETVQQRLL